MSNPNRRAFLLSASLAGIGTAVMLPSAIAAIVPPVTRDALLIRLGEVFATQEKAYRAARAGFDDAASQAVAVWPVVPQDMRVRRSWPAGRLSECPVSGGFGYERGERQSYSVVDEGDIQYRLDIAMSRRPRIAKSIREKADEVAWWSGEMKRLEGFEAECDAVCRRFDIPSLAEARAAAKRALVATMQQIYITPAEDITGLAVKARVLESEAAHLADVVTAKFKMPGSIARDIAWIAIAQKATSQ